MAANAQSVVIGIMLILVVLVLIAFIIYHFITINKYCPQIYTTVSSEQSN